MDPESGVVVSLVSSEPLAVPVGGDFSSSSAGLSGGGRVLNSSTSHDGCVLASAGLDTRIVGL